MNITKNMQDPRVLYSPLEYLSQDILVFNILQRLSLRDIGACSQVSSQLNFATQDENLWVQLYNRDLEPYYPSPCRGLSFQDAYADRYTCHENCRQGLYSEFTFKDSEDDDVGNKCIAVSNGRLYTTMADGRIKIWEIKKNRIEASNERGAGPKLLSSLVSICDQNVWHHTCSGHSAEVTCFAFYRGRLFSGSLDKTIKVWDAWTGRFLSELQGHTGAVQCLLVHRGKLFSGSDDGTIKVWDANVNPSLFSRKLPSPLMTLTGHAGGVSCLAAYGLILFSGSKRNVTEWHIETGKRFGKYTLSLPGSLTSLVVSDQRLFVGSENTAEILSWDILWEGEGGEFCADRMRSAGDFFCSTQAIAIADGMLFVGDNGGHIRIWNVKTRKYLSLNYLVGHTQSISSLTYSDGKLFSFSLDKTVKVWNFHAKRNEVLQNIADQFRKCPEEDFYSTSPVIQRFRKMPKKTKNKIFGELYSILKPVDHDYWGCGEHAFYCSHGDGREHLFRQYHRPCATNEERAEAIEDYLEKNDPVKKEPVSTVVCSREAHMWDAVFCSIQ